MHLNREQSSTQEQLSGGSSSIVDEHENDWVADEGVAREVLGEARAPDAEFGESHSRYRRFFLALHNLEL